MKCERVHFATTHWPKPYSRACGSRNREGGRRLFVAFTALLEEKTVIAREGSIIDASFTEAPRQRKSREQNRRIKKGERLEEADANPATGSQRDTGAHWPRKDSQSYDSYKNHAKVDLKSKLIIGNAAFPYRQYTVLSGEGLAPAINAFHHRICKCAQWWQQSGIQSAMLGLTSTA